MREGKQSAGGNVEHSNWLFAGSVKLLTCPSCLSLDHVSLCLDHACPSMPDHWGLHSHKFCRLGARETEKCTYIVAPSCPPFGGPSDGDGLPRGQGPAARPPGGTVSTGPHINVDSIWKR